MPASHSSADQSSVDAEARSDAGEPQADRRSGLKDRRVAAVDRRNEDRVADEFEPRRNPEVSDRRQG